MVELVSEGVEVTVVDYQEPNPNKELRFYVMTDEERSQLFRTIDKPAINDGRPSYATVEEAFAAGGRGNETPVWMEVSYKE